MRAWRGTAWPDETLAVEPGTCGADLAAAEGRVASRVQVLDIPPAALRVTEYQMMCRTCGYGQVTTARPPASSSRADSRSLARSTNPADTGMPSSMPIRFAARSDGTLP